MTEKPLSANGLIFDFYPNPADQEVSITMDCGCNEFISINIINIGGSTLFQYQKVKLVDKKTTLLLPNLFPGIYFIQIETENSISKLKKLIVK